MSPTGTLIVWLLLYVVTPQLGNGNSYRHHHEFDGRVMQAYGTQADCLGAIKDIKANTHDYGVCVEAFTK